MTKSTAIKILAISSLVQILTICTMAQSSRIRQNLNDNWNFSFDESRGKTQKVKIPHTWNNKDAFDDEAGYRRGISWYQRELKIDSSLKNKRLFLYFEAVNHTAEVFVNDKFIGSHIGGYTAFVFDVTDAAISFDNPNQITVKVDNRLDKDKPPIDGDWTMYGGIYRDVWLIATDEIHLKVTDFASKGVRIETPKVSESSAIVKLSGTVVNSSTKPKQIEVTNTIFDKQNRKVSEVKSIVSVNPNKEANFEQTTKQIYKPKLWSPDNPNLYTVKTSIKDGAKVLDEITQNLGFRWFKFDAKQGFFLNGKHLKLHGTNRHQDYAGLGNAVPENLQVKDLQIIKDNGFNFLRLAHYPQDNSVLEAADRLGLLIWEEIPIVNQIHVSEKFNENAKQMLREMIRQHRNHPSIILWGYMNEVFLPVPKSEDVTEATVNLAKELQQICKTEDASRPTTMAFDWGGRELAHTSGLSQVTDVIGWNLYHGWYYEKFEDFGKFLDEQHNLTPNKALIVSEYGANGDQRVHSLKPKAFDSSMEWQQKFHESYLPQINARKFIAGSAIWNQFDFGSEFRGETLPHINQKGMFSYDRQPKDISFYYKAHLSKERVLHIATRDWEKRGGNSRQTIEVYSNFKQTELLQNGNSLGVKEIDKNRKAVWNVELKDGINNFMARGGDNLRLFRKANWNVKFRDGVKSFVPRRKLDDDEPIYLDRIEVFYVNPNKFNEIAVNVGSDTEFLEDYNFVWHADQPYQIGSWGFVGESKETGTLRNILKTEDEPIFQTMREGLKTYKFDAPDGEYEIELHFAEPKFKEIGQRIFDVKINGETKIEKLDLVKEAGFSTAFAKQIRVLAKENKGIEISFTALKDLPIISGIRIKRIS